MPAVPSSVIDAVVAGSSVREPERLGEWSADAPRDVLFQLGVTGPAPSEKTIRVQLSRTDDGVLSAAIGRWLRPRADRRRASLTRTVIAVDGKTTRGARVTSAADVAAPHLLAAFDHDTGVVLGQRQIDGKGSEIGEFPGCWTRSTSLAAWSPRTHSIPSADTSST